jgi:putative oxidoreductase
MLDIISLGLLIIRVIAGLTIAAHGAQKLLGWFGGHGFGGTVQMQEKMSFNPPLLWALLVILGEFGGGLSFALGFLTPLGAAGILGAMVMAMIKVHWKNGFFNTKGGIEYPLTLIGIAVGIGLAGPGRYALDSLLGIALPGPLLFGVLAIAALLVDGIGILISHSPAERPGGTRAAQPH